MNANVINPPGTWGIAHIVYFVISTLLLVASLILIKRLVKNEKSKVLLVKIFAIILLVLILTNRIGYTIQYVVVEHREGYTWTYIFPETICAITAFGLSISSLFKKDNWGLHAFIHLAIIGALIVHFYPNFLDSQNLWEVGTITSLLFHTFMLFLAILLIITDYIKLSTKKWYIEPLTYMALICYGLFYINIIGPGIVDIERILNINKPLVDSLPTLTSWWMIGIGYLLWTIVFLFIYDHLINKKSFKVIMDEFIHFYRYINK